MNKKIKLLYLITGLNIGGAEMMLFRMLQNINHNIFEVVVITLTNKGILGKAIQSELGISVYELGLKSIYFIRRAIFSFGLVAKDFKPDIVHSHMYHANIFSRLSRLFYRFPVLICTIHNLDEKGRRKTAICREKAYRYTDRFADFTTQVSMAGYKKYLHIKAVNPDKFAYMPNGIDPSLFKKDIRSAIEMRRELSIENNYIFLAVGSLTTQKDYHNMLDAFAVVSKNESTAVLIIAGGGPLKDKLIDYCRILYLTEKVIFLGIRKDVPALMNMADCFVMSSAWEGLPVVLLEAAAAGLPIVTTNVGGNSEVVLDGKNGFVVPSKNCDALSSSMLKMIRLSENNRAEFISNAQEHILNNFDIKIVADKWQRIYIAMSGGESPFKIISNI